jgi:hypothetical protein
MTPSLQLTGALYTQFMEWVLLLIEDINVTEM